MFIYIGDPMCSWCYGFAPVYRELRETFATEVDNMMIMGGLRPGTEEIMDDKTKKFIEGHWKEVHSRTGRPFDHSFFDRYGFVYDTEIPARAVVTLRQTHPEKEWDFYEQIQNAFYAENKDTNDPSTYTSIVKKMNLELENFETILDSDQMKQATSADFQLSRKMGVNGYPTVLLHANEKLSVLTMGYQSIESLMPAVQSWLSEYKAD